MKKYLFLAICLLFLPKLNAQTYTSGHIHIVAANSMFHDSTVCQTVLFTHYNVTIDSAYTGEIFHLIDTLTGLDYHGSPVMDTFGSSPWTFTISGYSYYIDDDQLLGGVFADFRSRVPAFKAICGLDTLRYLVNHDSMFVTNACHYDTVSGHVYIDNDASCSITPGDNGLNGVFPEVDDSLLGAFPYRSYILPTTYYSGYYNFRIQKSWMYNYTVNLPAYYAFIFPFSSCYLSTSYLFTALPHGNVDFPLTCTSNVDVQCDALAPPKIGLHRSFFIHPYVTNTGCDTASGELHFILDHRVIYDPALSVHPADSVHGDTLIWNYYHLTNLSGYGYWNSFISDIHLTLDTTVVAGDTMCFSGYANIPPADIYPANNAFSFCLPVVYSYDPNVKEVTPAGVGTEGYISPGTDSLTYTLHFQNTGTAPAINIVITDTLDSHLNPGSIRILGTSHVMEPKWIASNVVQFTFSGIYLPDSTTNWAASQGQVKFSIRLNHGLPVGTVIKNKGYIYFDANPPVITNTTKNTLGYTLGANQITTNSGVVVYPNPATDQLTILNLNGGELTVLSMNGSELIKQKVTQSKAIIDISQLPAGVYILRVLNNDNAAIVKFTKY